MYFIAYIFIIAHFQRVCFAVVLKILDNMIVINEVYFGQIKA